jgi:hypothetical protein
MHMLRSRDRHRRSRAAAAIAVTVAVGFASAFGAVAHADPVDDFNVQLKDIKPSGAYTVVFTANQYDTSGERPPQVTANSLRLAAGLTIRPQFLTSRYRCDVTRMRDIVLENPEKKGPPRSKRFADLGRTLAAIRGELTASEIAVVRRCIHARIGQGTATADARPFTSDTVPAKLTLYLAKPALKGAIASIGVLAAIDESSKAYAEQRLLRLPGPAAFSADIFNEPSRDGRYGYRIALPTPPTGLVLNVKFSLTEISVTAPGLTERTNVVTCARRAGGRCTKTKVATRSTFWLTQPKCPASGTLPFEASYAYETGFRTTKSIAVPCPRFAR